MKVLILGATGLAGGSVLKACLAAPTVDEIRSISRCPVGVRHQKLHEFIHDDFLNYSRIVNAYTGIDACLFCLGVSVMQVSDEAEYRRITHDFAIAAARELKRNNPQAVFHYISGQGTRLGSRMMWARVKAQTEQDLMELMPAVAWRPSFIDGDPSAHTPKLLKILHPAFRLLKPFRNLYVNGEDIGRAMIQATIERIHGRVIENAEIRELAKSFCQNLPRN